jgi:hypothetical protein
VQAAPLRHRRADAPVSDVRAETDLALGGRWSSLRTGEREWLWRNPAVTLADRAAARHGAAFVDAGGGEECLPSINGDPSRGHDHGDVWCRPWVGEPADAAVRTAAGLTLRRRMDHRGGVVRADYEISGRPGEPFLHAVHLLLDVSEAATLTVSGSPVVTRHDHPGPGEVTRSTWPSAAGVRLDILGPVDGTATGAVVASDAVEIHDGEDILGLRWGTEGDAPTSFLVWRNLGGWPAAAPYRSVGIEPMVGATATLAGASADEVARLGADGRLTWWLEVSGRRASRA